MELRNSKTLLAALALVLGSALALSGCGAEEPPEAEPEPTVAEETQAPGPESTPGPEPTEEAPEPEPEPVVPVWEDHSGTWCLEGGQGCYGFDPTVATATWNEQYLNNVERQSEHDRCFYGLLIAANGGGGESFFACLAGVPSPGTAPTGATLAEADESRDRMWVGQTQVWDLIAYRQ